jgi:hypothetical protein
MSEQAAETGETGAGNRSSSTSCAALTASGAPCRAVRLAGEAFCIFHSQEERHREMLAQGRSAGGLARLVSLRAIELGECDWESISGLEKIKTALLEALRNGRVEVSRANALLSACDGRLADLRRAGEGGEVGAAGELLTLLRDGLRDAHPEQVGRLLDYAKDAARLGRVCEGLDAGLAVAGMSDAELEQRVGAGADRSGAAIPVAFDDRRSRRIAQIILGHCPQSEREAVLGEIEAFLRDGGSPAGQPAGATPPTLDGWPQGADGTPSAATARPGATSCVVFSDDGDGGDDLPDSTPAEAAVLVGSAVPAVTRRAEPEPELRRRPGDPPVMPEGSKVYGSVEDWDPYERYQR